MNSVGLGMIRCLVLGWLCVCGSCFWIGGNVVVGCCLVEVGMVVLVLCLGIGFW